MEKYDIPPNVKDAIDAYVLWGQPTGSFTEAVLTNDLKGAIGGADQDSLRCILDIVRYVYWEVPGSAQGSPERLDAWLRHGGMLLDGGFSEHSVACARQWADEHASERAQLRLEKIAQDRISNGPE